VAVSALIMHISAMTVNDRIMEAPCFAGPPTFQVWTWRPPRLIQIKRSLSERWSHFLRQLAKVGSSMLRMTDHEDAETVFG
jgi:hypothetical protein